MLWISSHANGPAGKAITEEIDILRAGILKLWNVEILLIFDNLNAEPTRNLIIDRSIGLFSFFTLFTPSGETAPVNPNLSNPFLKFLYRNWEQQIGFFSVYSAKNLT